MRPVIPQPGHALVGADEDQIELRMASALAGASRYLEVFEVGGDPHTETALMIFGDLGRQMYDHACTLYGKKKAKEEPKWSRMRDFAKIFCYLCIYGGGDETAHVNITSTEDDKGELIYKDISLREIRSRRRTWLDASPEFAKWWDTTLAKKRKQGFLTDPVLGRRCDFISGDGDEEARNKILNFECQSGAAGVIHKATLQLVNGGLPFFRWGPGTGLIQQGHDALVAEVPIAEAENVASMLQEAMSMTIPGLPVKFTASAKIGPHWGKV